ncbi:ferredoxin [Patescibacteria group bacterium]|nr:ferredoxin [Patescibacteria group bacterium]MBU1256203.1 ferredoxin [Patescibacteria group bacterium]MBU1457729.1 ferredoxin [Patescibacteria group bacterium]
MKVKINKKECIGCAMCVNFAEEVFELVDGKARVKKGVDLEKYKKKIKEAVEMCPVEAVKVED